MIQASAYSSNTFSLFDGSSKIESTKVKAHASLAYK
jgi:hypothetical protein